MNTPLWRDGKDIFVGFLVGYSLSKWPLILKTLVILLISYLGSYCIISSYLKWVMTNHVKQMDFVRRNINYLYFLTMSYFLICIIHLWFLYLNIHIFPSRVSSRGYKISLIRQSVSFLIAEPFDVRTQNLMTSEKRD